jgi:hypothetical protein
VARYDHLELVRLPEQFERRKHGGGGPPPARDRDQHSTKLRDELDAATQDPRFESQREACNGHTSGGQFWTPIPRLRGSILHAE